MIKFDLKKTDSEARAGVLHTAHCDIPTPAFMPVGTQATVKTLEKRDLIDLDYRIYLNNMYHLYLRPGVEIIEKMGGLHGFTGWDRGILTDSGGFQIFSMTGLTRIKEEGVRFQSHIDGSYHFMTPERATEIQYRMRPDIIMAFDQCLAYPSDDARIQHSTELTLRWLNRCKNEWGNRLQADPNQHSAPALFGIIQGGVSKEHRIFSAAETVKLDLPGYAIGGLSVGEPKNLMWPALEACIPEMPVDKPRYLMGVGTPLDLVEAVARGIDMFDCVMPTRNGRKGTVFTWDGKLSLKAAYSSVDTDPIDSECGCYACKNYSKAFIRHLFNVSEITAMRLGTLHNLFFYKQLMEEIRLSILENRFARFREEFHNRYKDEIIRSHRTNL